MRWVTQLSIHHDKKGPLYFGKLVAFQCSVCRRTPLLGILGSASYKLRPTALDSTLSNLHPNLWLVIIYNSVLLK